MSIINQSRFLDNDTASFQPNANLQTMRYMEIPHRSCPGRAAACEKLFDACRNDEMFYYDVWGCTKS